MAYLGYSNTKVKKLYYQNTEVKKAYYQNVLVLDNSFPSITPGDTITWDNKSWLVCHYDSTNNRVYLIAKDTISETVFGSNTKYKGSTLANYAKQYQSQQMSAAALAQCVDVTVPSDGEYGTQYDVTAKVFVPSYTQMNGGFSWFNSDSHRKVNGAAGYSKYYWTSSASTSERVFLVLADGSLIGYDRNGDPSRSNGFRPCICVQL